MSANTEWLLSVRGKLGWIGWNTLWYVTGGGAWVNTEFTATTQVLAQAAGPNIPNPYQSNTSFNTTQSGWVLGGGAEWQATTNILIRAEYLYYNLHNGVTASVRFLRPLLIRLRYPSIVGPITTFRSPGSLPATSSKCQTSAPVKAPIDPGASFLMGSDPFNDDRAPTRGRVERRGRVWRFFGCANLSAVKNLDFRRA